MKLSDAKEWLPIIQAAAEGKTIQALYGDDWVDLTTESAFRYKPSHYRIKPEPKLIKGAAYLCWDDDDEDHMLQFYVGDYGGEPRFSSCECDGNLEWCTDWDNWELFVQPPEALDQ